MLLVGEDMAGRDVDTLTKGCANPNRRIRRCVALVRKQARRLDDALAARLAEEP